FKHPFVLALCGSLVVMSGAFAQEATAPSSPQDATPSISWEVKNRFRLFVSGADFETQVNARKAAIAQGANLSDLTLKTEQILSQQTEGEGWARELSVLCVDGTGKLVKSCRRGPDGTVENMINPQSHFIELRAALPASLSGAQCAWTIDVAPSSE